jgi:hypothetical protein
MHPAIFNRVERTEAAILRGLMVAMAAGTWFVGFSLLTSPLAIPFTLGVWAAAVGMAWLGIFGSLPTDGV